jgi:uncharacterized protein (TIGR02145 family)
MRLLLFAALAVLSGCGSNGKSGILTDARDGKRYKTVKMPDGKTWMAENLNYRTDRGSCCYNDSNYYCDKYGRLYNWKAAKTACPKGWHLPSREEWDELMKSVVESKRIRDAPPPDSFWEDGTRINYYPNFDTMYYWPGAGTKLKATDGWYDLNGNSNGNGTDDYGFSALPGGFCFLVADSDENDVGGFDAGDCGIWWVATEIDSIYAYYLLMTYETGHVDEGGESKYRGKSARCVED